jgi:hypothetical protein
MPGKRPPADEPERPTARESISRAAASAGPRVSKAVEAAGPRVEKAANSAGGLLRTLRTRAQAVAEEFTQGYGNPDEERPPGTPTSADRPTPNPSPSPRPAPADRPRPRPSKD